MTTTSSSSDPRMAGDVIRGHSALYQAWEGAPTVVVMTPDLAAALDDLLMVVSDVVGGQSHDMDLGPTLDRVRALHNFEAVQIGGKPLTSTPAPLPDAERIGGEPDR